MTGLLLFVLCWTITISQPAQVIDGDTFDVSAHIWHHLWAYERVRVLDIDTPEMKKLTLQAALRAKAFTESWLAAGPFEIRSCKRDSFGRILGKVSRGQQLLAEELHKAGHTK